MASFKKEKVRNPKVSVAVVAIDEGYYKNRIVRIGERFLFEGEFEKNSEGEYCLASWMEPQNFPEFEKLSKAAKASQAKEAKPVKESAPGKKGSAADVMAEAPTALV